MLSSTEIRDSLTRHLRGQEGAGVGWRKGALGPGNFSRGETLLGERPSGACVWTPDQPAPWLDSSVHLIQTLSQCNPEEFCCSKTAPLLYSCWRVRSRSEWEPALEEGLSSSLPFASSVTGGMFLTALGLSFLFSIVPSSSEGL